MEIGFPFMGDRLSLCRYSWAKRLTVYSFIFSFLWVSFPRYSYSFVPAIAAVAARAVIPKVVGRVLVRRFAANDAIYTASQLTATRVFVGRAAANAAEYLPAASSYKMSGVATWAGIAAAVSRYLGNMNIRIWTKKGVDFIAPYTPKEPVKPRYTWTYTPQYRSVAYLSDILGGYVSGSFNNSGAVISDDSLKGSSGASNYINRTGDILVYYGTKEDIAILKTLVTSLDTMSDEVVVSGYVFEVQTSQSDGSGILLAAKILSDKFNISVGAAGLDNFINIRTGSIDAIFNLLKTDSRFTVVSAPRLRVKNNASASFSVGSDVPVLGSVTVNNNTTTQSVEYRSSGVLFNVTPSIKSRTMDLKIQQQLSNFVTTETGVNNSPTLIKRDVTTEVSLADGDIILLGGLAEQKDSKASSGWSFFGSRTSESNKTDIMVMLQVRKVDRSRATPRSAARSGELFRDNLN